MRSSFRRIGPEKAVFLAASAWLLVVGVRFARAPAVPEWGPPTTSLPRAAPARVSLGSPEEPFGGGRSPFAMTERHERKGGRRTEVETDGESERDRGGAGETEGTDGGSSRENGSAVTTVVVPREEIDARYVGSIRVEGSDRWTIIAEGERYVGLREGGEAEGLRLLKKTPAHLILETASGERIRVPVPGPGREPAPR